MILAGLVQIKDVFFPDLPIHLRMSGKGFAKLGVLMESASVGMSFIVGFLTTAFSTPCMMPLYIGTATVLARSGMEMYKIFFYFLYYNLVFILPMLVIWLVVSFGKGVLEMKEWEHKWGKWMRLAMGLMMIWAGWVIMR